MSSEFPSTAEQALAIQHPLSPLLVVAGAGTGKTSVMAERILHLVVGGFAAPDQILGLTFTNKAAAELKSRVRHRLGPDADVEVTTYHSFGARLVAEHALELDLHPRTQLLNRAQAWQLLFTVFDQFRFERRGSWKPDLIVTDALALASRCADHLVDVETVQADCHEIIERAPWKRARETALGRLELCQVVRRYEQRKRERGFIDFADQIRLSVRLLRDHPELAQCLRQQRPIVLLDEYQDTNYAQRVLLQLLYPPGSALTAVGDDMQSIYAFRGAHLENILRFDQHFPPVKRQPLSVNRRSGPQIVALANRIQSKVRRSLPKELRELDGSRPSVIECFLAADDLEEAREIATEIAELGPPWCDHAVLCRKRKLIPAIVSAIEELEIPLEVAGSSGLLDRPEIIDITAWLEVLADPTSTVALLRLLLGPRYRIGWRDLAVLARHGRSESPNESRNGARASGKTAHKRSSFPLGLAGALKGFSSLPELSSSAKARLSRFWTECSALSEVATRLPVLELAESIIQCTNLWGAVDDRGRENLLRFLDLAEQFTPIDGDPGLKGFVEYLQLLDQSEEELAEAHVSDLQAVQVMTVHQAKGLEFANVWVPGLAGSSGRWGIFPDSRGGENPLGQTAALPWWLRPDEADLPSWREVPRVSDIDDEVRRRAEDEEWRLFYVACTRAKRRLVCSSAQWYPGPSEPQRPSKFYEFVSAQVDIVTERFHHQPPAVDPAVAAMERRRASTRSAERSKLGGWETQELFDEYAGEELEGVNFDSSSPQSLGAGWDSASSSTSPETRHCGSSESLSVSSLVTYACCPRQFYWSRVRPLPRRASRAGILGTELHRWIELRNPPQLAIIDSSELLEPRPTSAAAGPTSPAPGVIGGLKASFLASPYASLVAERVEAPFELSVGDRRVRGRIDALYRRTLGGKQKVELVDFKTGRSPVDDDRGAGIQLHVYALAAVRAWHVLPDELRTTYCYLRPHEPPHLMSTDWDFERLSEVEEVIEGMIGAVESGEYQATPGEWCDGCPFIDFCPSGQAKKARS